MRALSRVDAPPERSRGLRWIGRLGGPVLAILLHQLLPSGPDGLTGPGRATASVGVLMAVWWMTESMPLPATALVPLALFPVLGIAPIGEAAAPYADKIIFLFMGGFMLALAMERWGLHRRIALHTVLIAGTEPSRLIGGFMVATAVLSMWVSNTATAVMMLPIGLSIVGLVSDRSSADDRSTRRFATALLLGIAYSASIGSVGTPIGTPPNLLLRGFVQDAYGIEIGFATWMAFGLPLVAIFLPLAWLLLTRVLYRTDLGEVAGGRSVIRAELAELGRPSAGEWTVLGVFTLTALAWVLREPITTWSVLVDRLPAIAELDDATIAIGAAIVLFALPVDVRRGVFALNWDTARQLPWGVLLLFGGGLSLASAIRTTGVDTWIGDGTESLGVLPEVLLVAAVTMAVILLTELTSNTATAATFLPILGGVAVGIGVDPLLLVLPAALAATFAFMLPVATPPNAIVFGSDRVAIGDMVRAGAWLNLLGATLIVGAVYTVGAWVLDVGR